MFRNRRDVRIELDVPPRFVEHSYRFESYTRCALIEGLNEYLPLGWIGEEFIENLEAVLDLTIVGHDVRIAHPNAFAVDNVERVLRARVVDQASVGLIWSLLEECFPLSLGIRHQNAAESNALFNLVWSSDGLERLVSHNGVLLVIILRKPILRRLAAQKGWGRRGAFPRRGKPL